MTPSKLILKPGRDKPVRNRHPWVFSGAVAQFPTVAQDGDVVDVYDAHGHWLARGHLNRRSQIVVRLCTWREDEPLDEGFWRTRLQRAWDSRAAFRANPETTAYRVVHGESDGLPGLVVDRYGEVLAVQFSTLAADRMKEALAPWLCDLTGASGLIERADPFARQREGLSPDSDLVVGHVPAQPIAIREHGFSFLVDVRTGQKTGFYLDQRRNRTRVASYLQPGGQVLNAFSYTGAFTVYALHAGAGRVVNVDSSVEALQLGEENVRRNGFDSDVHTESIAGDVFQVLRGLRDRGRTFDVVILDPPKFAQTQGQVEAAARGYKDINLLALKLLRPGGILATFSCSGLVSAELFQKIVFGAALDAGRDVQLLERLSQDSDHPVLLSFPEGEYLKGMICRAD